MSGMPTSQAAVRSLDDMTAPVPPARPANATSALIPPLQTEEVPQAEVEDHGDRPDGLLPVHLARPAPAVLEQDRVLAQLAPGLVAPEQYLLLERVPPRLGPLQVRLPQLAHPVAPERPARVLHRHPEQEPDQQVHRLADEPAA